MGSRARHGVFVVGDRTIVRREIERLIDKQADLTFAGEAADPGKALTAIVASAPDVVLVDIAGDGRRAIELIRGIRRQLPATAVLVMTASNEAFVAERALRQGARGHVTTRDDGAQIVTAIRRLVSGDIHVSERLSPILLQRLLRASAGDGISPLARLTERELQVFNLIGEGLRTREIAEELGLSVKTIEAHRGHIRRKLNLRGSQELNLVAARWTLGRERD